MRMMIMMMIMVMDISWRRSLPAPVGAKLPRKRWIRPSIPSLVVVGSDDDDEDGDGYLMEKKESSSSRWSKAIYLTIYSQYLDTTMKSMILSSSFDALFICVLFRSCRGIWVPVQVIAVNRLDPVSPANPARLPSQGNQLVSLSLSFFLFNCKKTGGHCGPPQLFLQLLFNVQRSWCVVSLLFALKYCTFM